MGRFLSETSTEAIRKQIELHRTLREKEDTTVEITLSHESKRVLLCASAEAERLCAAEVNTEHLLLGILREETCFAASLLKDHAVSLSAVDKWLARRTKPRTPLPPLSSTLVGTFSRDVTKEAFDGQLDPIVEREQEMARVLLCGAPLRPVFR
jgi:ATP-dependent Clp protease ATP-binding subunit ClpC